MEEFQQEQQYQSLCVSAIISLVLGILSPLVLLGAVLALAPAGAILMATHSLSRIRQSDGALAGRTMALAGLALGVGSLSMWAAQQQVAYYLEHRRAGEVAERFFHRLASGELPQAYLMTLNAEDRGAMRTYFAENPVTDRLHEHAPHGDTPAHASHALPPGQASPTDRWFDFRELPAVRDLAEGPAIESIALTRRAAIEPRGPGRKQLSQSYQITRDKARPLTLDVVIEAARQADGATAYRVIHAAPAAP